MIELPVRKLCTRRGETARRLDDGLPGEHRRDQRDRVPLSVRALPTVARGRRPVARRAGGRDPGPLRPSPRGGLAPHLCG